jgi:hypothetical protein
MSTGKVYGRVRPSTGKVRIWPGGVQYEYGSTGPYIGPYPYSVLLGKPSETQPRPVSACVARAKAHARYQSVTTNGQYQRYAPGCVVMRGMEP